MTQIRRLTLEEHYLHKDLVIDFFNKKLEKYPPVTESADRWFDGCLTGEFQLWGFFKEDLKGIGLTSISNNSIDVLVVSGPGIIKDLEKFPDILSEFAKEQNVRYVQTITTPSMAKKVYPRFDQRPMTLVLLDTWAKH